MPKTDANSASLQRVRIDKWLWAARFFKTRTLAKQAVEGGKVHYQGSRVKAGKEIQLGAELSIRQGYDELVVIVTGLSDRRGPAKIAQSLYQETEQSLCKRTENSLMRKSQKTSEARPSGKPNKKERRKIMKLNKME